MRDVLLVSREKQLGLPPLTKVNGRLPPPSANVLRGIPEQLEPASHLGVVTAGSENPQLGSTMVYGQNPTQSAIVNRTMLPGSSLTGSLRLFRMDGLHSTFKFGRLASMEHIQSSKRERKKKISQLLLCCDTVHLILKFFIFA